MKNLINFDQFGKIQKPFNWFFILGAIVSVVGIGVLIWFWHKAQIKAKGANQTAATLPEVAEVKFSATITPNPTKGQITLEVDFHEEKELLLRIYTKQGHTLRHQQKITMPSNELDVSFLAPGFYQAVLENEAETKALMIEFEKQ